MNCWMKLGSIIIVSWTQKSHFCTKKDNYVQKDYFVSSTGFSAIDIYGESSFYLYSCCDTDQCINFTKQC